MLFPLFPLFPLFTAFTLFTRSTDQDSLDRPLDCEAMIMSSADGTSLARIAPSSACLAGSGGTRDRTSLGHRTRRGPTWGERGQPWRVSGGRAVSISTDGRAATTQASTVKIRELEIFSIWKIAFLKVFCLATWDSLDMMADYLTTDEVAAKLRLNNKTIRRMLLGGRLPGVRIGRQWRIPEPAIAELLAGKSNTDEIQAYMDANRIVVSQVAIRAPSRQRQRLPNVEVVGDPTR